MAGYHNNPITKGVIGDVSKIEEELCELKDAIDQKNKILTIVELSDLYGAISLYVEKQFPFLSMEDLRQMSELTRRAFQDGKRN